MPYICERCGARTYGLYFANCDTHGRTVHRYELPAKARTTDPETSHEAARSVTNIRESQRLVLDMLRVAGPLTDEEILARLSLIGYRLTPSGTRTRRSELVDAGLVRDSGARRRLATGRRAVVWELAER